MSTVLLILALGVGAVLLLIAVGAMSRSSRSGASRDDSSSYGDGGASTWAVGDSGPCLPDGTGDTASCDSGGGGDGSGGDSGGSDCGGGDGGGGDGGGGGGGGD